jgi:hypothetical protein
LGAAHADNYDDTLAVFKKAGESADFFRHSYAYAYPSGRMAGKTGSVERCGEDAAS